LAVPAFLYLSECRFCLRTLSICLSLALFLG